MKPIISVIIPVYNEEKRIAGCLDSIYSQEFPKNKVEVLVIDDDSTDKTIEIAKKYPVKILRNGKRDYDIGKAIGINNSSGKFLLFIDADNRLIDKKWLFKAVRIMEKEKNVLGLESWKFFYSARHNLATRYQDLFGNTDPAVFYLNRQDHLQCYENNWTLGGEIVEDKEDYVIVRFEKENLPSLGSQGFLTRKKYFSGNKVFQHIEFFISLLDREKKGVFCFLKNEVEHLAFKKIGDITKKFKRNIQHYIKDEKTAEQKRYSLNFFRMLKIFLIMATIAVPVYDSIKGYIKKKDAAWFLHAYLSLTVAWIYSWNILIGKLKAIYSP